MPLSVTQVAETCNLITQQVHERYRALTIHYIVHREGRRAEALGLAAQEIIDHPAAETAAHLLTRAQQAEESTLVGVAVAREHLFGGLATRDSLLALCTINVDQYDSLRDARNHANHLAWHAIDAFVYHANPDNRSGQPQEIIVRRRSTLELADACLQADVFSTIVGGQHGERDGIARMGAMRGLAALQAREGHFPERYPFLLAMEATQVAMDRLRQHPVGRRKQIDAALRTGRQIARAFDEETRQDWINFGEPAQAMAWRGSGAEDILGAAIATSENVNVRATAHLVAQVTGITPSPTADVEKSYSPFADDIFNQRLHERAVEAVFSDVIAEGIMRHSADPFAEAAMRQNMRLINGHVLGWCAGALQISGRAFRSALESGREAEKAARREFDGERGRTPWKALDKLGENVIGRRRDGELLGLADIAKLNRDDQGLGGIRASIETTLKEQATLAPRAAPAPVAVARPASPAPARIAAPALAGGGPRFGGGGRTTVITRREPSKSAPAEETEKRE